MSPLEQLKIELRATLHGLNVSQTQLRSPDRPDSWTIQQIVEHLRLSYVSTLGAMQARTAKRVATKMPVTLMGRTAQFAITRCGYFPKGQKAPAMVFPGELVPLDGDAVYTGVSTDMDRMAATIDEVERMLGTGRTVTHARLGPMSAMQWRRFHLVHGRHHVRQILRIRG